MQNSNVDIHTLHTHETNLGRQNSKSLLNPKAAASFGESLDNKESSPTDWLTIARNCIIPQGVKIPEPIVLFEINETPILTQGQMSLLIAKPKNGKSTVASWIVGTLIKEGKKALVVDTEQGLYYSSRSQFWTLNVADTPINDNLTYLDIKKFNTDERLQILEAYLKVEGNNLDIMVLDGVRDLLLDINDNKEVSQLTNTLMRWADEYQLHILSILHKNKVDSNPRGVQGTEMQNKCETVLNIETEGAQIVISPLYTRNESFAPFALVRDSYGVPQYADGYTIPVSEAQRKAALRWDDISRNHHIRLLKDVFGNGTIKPRRSDLEIRLSNVYSEHCNIDLGGKKIKSLFDYLFNDLGLIKKDGNDRSPKAYYYLTTDHPTQHPDFTGNELT
ncbi:AAA family ATPase [Sphingobacterium sp. UBA2074]|uniref:AAA family ATPase n=1 Tax=Sphingobacterium sp. UBA2074 TaxID=1947487 RepID=UPI00257E3453|nr:AAA family ATPase [Sphingobacterium sp. UBA2074]